MIKSKFPFNYGDREERIGIVSIEVIPIETKIENKKIIGIKYLVNDWDISKVPKQIIKSKEVFYDTVKINEVNDYLEANNDFSQMTKCEREYRKLELALLLDTQTNLFMSGKTVYGLTPNDWELCEV